MGIEGYVTSESGAGVSNATLIIDGVNRTVKTDANGHYNVVLGPGKYTATVAGPNFLQTSKVGFRELSTRI